MLLSELQPAHMREIRSIAVHHLIDYPFEASGHHNTVLPLFDRATESMPNLNEFLFVYTTDGSAMPGLPQGGGPIRLYSTFQSEWSPYLDRRHALYESQGGQDRIPVLPAWPYSTHRFSFNKSRVQSVWGTRPVALPILPVVGEPGTQGSNASDGV